MAASIRLYAMATAKLASGVAVRLAKHSPLDLTPRIEGLLAEQLQAIDAASALLAKARRSDRRK